MDRLIQTVGRINPLFVRNFEPQYVPTREEQKGPVPVCVQT